MKTAGIVAEYNPFHAGHRYHIEKTRELTGADYVIAVMSGNFVQRGEPACTDKYMRTRMALDGGADLVIELPVIYATASAEAFASAGVRLLDSLGCVDYLSFGSEWAGIADYQKYVRILSREEEPYRKILQNYLRQGYSYPKARSLAVGELLGEPDYFLKEPNHILGLEYMKALNRLGSSIAPVSVIRQGAAYHEEELSHGLPSATAIRKALRDAAIIGAGRRESNKSDNHDSFKGAADLKEFIRGVPGELCSDRLIKALGEYAEIFLKHIRSGETVWWDDLIALLDYEMLMRKAAIDGVSDSNIISDQSQTSESERQLLTRILRLYQPGCSIDQVIESLHSRNRTDSSIRRTLLHILLRIDSIRAEDESVPYARILGFRREAVPLLRLMKETSSIPIIQKPARGSAYLSKAPKAMRIYQADLLAADLYEQAAARKAGRKLINEIRRQQVIVK